MLHSLMNRSIISVQLAAFISRDSGNLFSFFFVFSHLPIQNFCFIYFFVDDSVRCQHTSSPLGNGAIVETSDKQILLLQRSYNVGEFPGYFVFPGGHSEVMH